MKLMQMIALVVLFVSTSCTILVWSTNLTMLS